MLAHLAQPVSVNTPTLHKSTLHIVPPCPFGRRFPVQIDYMFSSPGDRSETIDRNIFYSDSILLDMRQKGFHRELSHRRARKHRAR